MTHLDSNKPGFDKRLYILPFDHRGSFQKKMFGWDGQLTSQQTAETAAAKWGGCANPLRIACEAF